MSLDLNKLENKLDEALIKETSETLTKFLNDKRMTNNKQQTEINAVEYLDKVNQFAKENNTDKPKQQTAVEWLAKQMEILHYDYWAEHISKDEKNQRLKQLKEQAKEMEIAGKEMSYSDGYAQGYQRALDYISMSIENAKALISTEII